MLDSFMFNNLAKMRKYANAYNRMSDDSLNFNYLFLNVAS